MPSLIRTIETDVCVVGAGLIGLAHAHEARRRGLGVVLLERGARATGASVRDSGHLFFSALPAGRALDAAPLARERWIDLARRAGARADEGGTLIIAHRPEELAVLEATACDPGRHARMRSPKKIGKLAPIPVDGVLGGFHAKQDLRIDPRSATAALARLLGRDPSARIEWGAHVHEIEPGAVHAGALRVRAGAIVVCPGADYQMLPRALWSQESPLTLSRSQMLRLASPVGHGYRQTLTTGSSLLGYPGFCAAGAMQSLGERLELESPELVEGGVNLVVAQLGDGDLVVGSTTTYADARMPFSRERLDLLMLGQARSLLGFTPDVRQRWSGTHVRSRRSPDDFLVTRPMPGVRLVHAVSSTANCLCHTQAATVLDELLSGPPHVDMYITVHDIRKAGTRIGGVRDHARAFGPRTE